MLNQTQKGKIPLPMSINMRVKLTKNSFTMPAKIRSSVNCEDAILQILILDIKMLGKISLCNR